MSQINDCIHRALGSGHINDLLVEYFQTYGATSFQVNDAAYEFLISYGATPGSLDDMWFEFLRGRGYIGSLNDMLLEFWCVDGGGVGPDLIFRVNHIGDLVDAAGGTLTNNRPTPATIVDYEGIVHICLPNEIRYSGARRVDHADGQMYNAGVLGIQYFDTNAGGGTISPKPRMLHEPSSTNVILQNVDMTTGWIQRNAGTATWDPAEQAPDGSPGASLLEGIAESSTGDVFQNVTSGLPADTLLAVSFYIKKVAVAGTLRVSNSQAGSLGDWHVNWGLISDEWELITKDHPAVSVVAPFKSHATSGESGLVFNGTTTSQASFYAWGSQQEALPFSTSTIITQDTATTLPEEPEVLAIATRDQDDIRLPLVDGVNFIQEAGVLVFSTTYLSPYPLTESADGLLSTTSSAASVLYDHNLIDRFATYDGTNLANMVTSALENSPMLFSVVWDASTLRMAIGYSPDMGATWVPWGESAYKGTFQVATLISLFKGNRNRNALGFALVTGGLVGDTVQESKDWVESRNWGATPSNAVLHFGDAVEFNGEEVTHG